MGLLFQSMLVEHLDTLCWCLPRQTAQTGKVVPLEDQKSLNSDVGDLTCLLVLPRLLGESGDLPLWDLLDFLLFTFL